MPRMPQYLFVVGLGRSGTTALARVVGSHPQVALGVERYKFLWKPQNVHRLVPDLFAEERFFDFAGSRTTNITPDVPVWSAYYEEVRGKYASAAYVGDKLTEPGTMPALAEQFPRPRFLCIVRDVAEVAHSWQARATNPGDRGWRAEYDARAAVKFWNESLVTMLDVREQCPDLVCFVEYADFFGANDDRPLRRVLRFLQLPMTDEIGSAFARARKTHREKIAPKRRDLPGDVAEFVEQEAAHELWHAARALGN